MTDFYDALETRSPEEREAANGRALAAAIAHAQANAPAYADLLSGVDAASVDGREALASLPVTRKSTMSDGQRARPPFGGFAATDLATMARVFASPGPIYEPQGRRPDHWRFARALYAVGVRRGQLIHNTFSYHFTPAGAIVESAAEALGCPVFPAGVGQTELQIEAMGHLRPAAFAGTPSFLNILLDKAAELGRDISSLERGLVGGEALPPSLRAEIRSKGVDVYQTYATADIGLIAYESPALEGLIVDEGVLLEIVHPGTGDPVPHGEIGEILVTTFAPEYPLIRFATGDLTALLPGPSPCGRTNMRIKGWMGRADQTAKVKGMFVHPSQVVEVAGRHPEVSRARLVVESVDHADRMTLRCEVASPADGLADAVAVTLREICKLRGTVELVAPGSLPEDGRVIEDARTYD